MANYTDLRIIDGDIFTENGQFKIQKNEELIREAVLRRLKTPLNGYSVYSVDLDTSEVVILDADYGNLSYELTALDSQLVYEKLKDNISQSLSLEPRITLQNVTTSNDIIEGVSTIISYYLNEDQELLQNIAL
jgi:hypothetical protein